MFTAIIVAFEARIQVPAGQAASDTLSMRRRINRPWERTSSPDNLTVGIGPKDLYLHVRRLCAGVLAGMEDHQIFLTVESDLPEWRANPASEN